jgi:hypothetical protein
VVRLRCPLCGALVAEGAEPRAGGRCPGCGARHEGGAGDVPGAVRAALEAAGRPDADPAAVAGALFRLRDDDPLAGRVAITSDTRDGFYLWWVFVDERDETAGVLLSRLAGAAPAG